ncbi:MAG TPA: HAD-IA family hydrolase [Kineosporiaceae bacterium]|nr:HAD-IA family hydrolase [Kineosporiaceae bacterium]
MAPLTDPVLSTRTFDAVLFDLDGTLIDSTPVVERSWALWARRRGLDRIGFAVPHGIPARQVIASVLPPDQHEAALAEIEAIEVADVDGIRVLPGALEALAVLPAGRAAIATSGSAELARARIAATGLPAPAVVVTASDVTVGKPDPQPYLLAAARLGADPARCLVVEDAPAGITSGTAAGCTTLAVTTTHAPGELSADLVVRSLAEVAFVTGPDGIRLHRQG